MKLLVDDARADELSRVMFDRNNVYVLSAGVRDLLADRKTLKDAVAMLRVYAKHHLWCRSHRDETQCDCGFRVVQEATNAE